MKNLLSLCLLLAGCQPKSEQQSKDQQSSVTINGKQYSDSVTVDSAGNHIQVKSGNSRVAVKVSGSDNDIKITK